MPAQDEVTPGPSAARAALADATAAVSLAAAVSPQGSREAAAWSAVLTQGGQQLILGPGDELGQVTIVISGSRWVACAAAPSTAHA